jgi:hypothetical protein
MGTGGSFSGGKAARARRWPLTPIKCRVQEWWSYTSTPPCLRGVILNELSAATASPLPSLHKRINKRKEAIDSNLEWGFPIEYYILHSQLIVFHYTCISNGDYCNLIYAYF